MIKNIFKTAWRNLGKSKMHSFINIAGLSIGMSVAILIGLWMYDEVSFNKSFANHGRIAQVVQNVTNNGEVQTWTNVPYPLAEELRKNYGSDFKHIVMAVDHGQHRLEYGDKKLKQNGVFFEKDALPMFSVHMIEGSQGSLNDLSSIILSASVAKAYFGKEDAIGKMMKVDEMPPLKVTGVFEDFPNNSLFADLGFMGGWDTYYNNMDWIKTLQDPWRPNFAELFVQINDNADFASVSHRIKDAKLRRVNSQLAKKKPELFLQPLDRMHLYSEFKNGVNTGGAIQYVWMFGIIGVFVLLLACINFMNLSTARSERRAKEVGIRKTMGSLRKHLITQFFGESLLTVILAFVVSLVVVWLLLPFFNSISDKKMNVLWSEPLFWLFGVLFILFTSLVAGSYPALYLSSFKAVRVLKGTFKAGRRATIPRKVLVVVQFTVSVALIIGTIIVYRQIQFAKNRPVGYDRENLVSIPTPNPSIHQHFDAVKAELKKGGIISEMAEAGSAPTSGSGSSSGFSWKGKDPNLSIDFPFAAVSYEYGTTVGWQIRDGRDFSRSFATDSSAMVLNESAQRFMGLTKAIGETVYWFDRPYTVIGVADDMIMQSPYDPVKPTIFFLTTDPGDVALLRVGHQVGTEKALAAIASVFKTFNPEQPFEYEFIDDNYAKKFTSEVRIGKLAGFFAILAIAISCLGLFGLASFVAAQRTKEIGVRKVLGASAFSVWNLLSKEFILLVGISFIVAAPLAWLAMSRWLMDYSYRVNIGWQVFLIAGIVALAITLATVSFQAIRAAFTSPVRSLRTE